MRASRGAVLNVFRVEMSIAHMGFGIVIIACALVGVVWSPRAAVIIAGAFFACFLVALVVLLCTGRRGWAAVRAAYKSAFGWANWITP
ncbi:hypothetical protein [Streptomyces mesophilus]|uniref:hypothetical protein n=1 Tax=Streptomyces mesophilus TaxID=1775132 RepID=UPI0033246067